jgi:hypothetical protein
MPEWDSAYGASSKASFDAGQAPKGTYGGGNGNKSGNGKQHVGGNGKKVVQAGATTFSLAKKSLPASWLWEGAKKVGSLFTRTPEQKRAAYTKKGLDITNPAEMHGYQTQYGKINEGTHQGGDGIANVTTHTQSLVTAPTADKGAGFGHQWNFQAYGNQAQTTANPYDYTKAPYAKKGKMIRTYATGQEIKNFSKGKRFGPPPLKGPDSQGLQVILENSDYFKKLIG